MGVYSIKGKGWYDFVLNGQRYTEAWFTTARKARAAEVARRKEVRDPPPQETQIPTDTELLELVNRRLDHLRAYHSPKHYEDYRYLARKWVKLWSGLKSCEVTPEMIEDYLLQRNRVSPLTANKELRSLRSLFNFGKKRKLVEDNPTDDLQFLPVEKKIKYVPPQEEIDLVIDEADQDMQDYLWIIRETLARVSEINRLTWDDVNLAKKDLILYTRKKKGGSLTPRKVPMTEMLYAVLCRRFMDRDKTQPWLFWHTYWSNKTGEKQIGPYKSRRKKMRTLCGKAGVRYFCFHALRHSGASVMESANVPLGSIQRILAARGGST